MAILKGIEASVIIDGKALTEYDDEDARDEISDYTREVSKYIEAVSDAEFSIGFTVPKSYNFGGDALSFKINLDGVCIRSIVCREAKLKNLRKDWHVIIAGHQVKNGEEWYLRPFKFKDIKISKTNPPYADLPHSLRNSVEASVSTAGSGKSNNFANLGTITIDVFDVKVMGRSYNETSTVSLGHLSEAAEKELKGRDVTLQAAYANPNLLMIEECLLIFGKLW